MGTVTVVGTTETSRHNAATLPHDPCITALMRTHGGVHSAGNGLTIAAELWVQQIRDRGSVGPALIAEKVRDGSPRQLGELFHRTAKRDGGGHGDMPR